MCVCVCVTKCVFCWVSGHDCNQNVISAAVFWCSELPSFPSFLSLSNVAFLPANQLANRQPICLPTGQSVNQLSGKPGRNLGDLETEWTLASLKPPGWTESSGKHFGRDLKWLEIQKVSRSSLLTQVPPWRSPSFIFYHLAPLFRVLRGAGANPSIPLVRAKFHPGV